MGKVSFIMIPCILFGLLYPITFSATVIYDVDNFFTLIILKCRLKTVMSCTTLCMFMKTLIWTYLVSYFG